ncbi:MAG: molybdopterin converting factor subunit 1 [Flavobacteriia bacterium]|nr:molybdopterin converting factor subunit 1 [Flavobacteriia bacterium]OIP46021.1 MAG: molybdopterin converting factor subunit 1 [Flavobacteriaceae bacterium CG2_30_31_66]PIV95838.1 MAG: molybdopterin converting factor subunit 1 [Flavobacteriaceae bacterium CG17_big_fil_post_rev_8_21_14_2_50_31_13]PIX13283.1 MAG: molybdopterin converting factor subunit 1 [Flavobacteriaceae bacterium CG_4_8_14_3_um_filter_31_8]PIY15323.1 MAG: molybdopterin converting factor subunit 1 [Flavobacteriaceae bacterium
MTIKILFFGISSDLVKSTEISFLLEQKATVHDCKEALIKQFPKLKIINSFAIAVNENYATDEVSLKNGDVVAIIPPVSGG